MKNIVVILYLFFTFLCIFFYSFANGEYNSFFLIFPLVLLFLFILLKNISNKVVDWFSIDVIFLGVFYLIHFGYLFSYELGYVDYDNEVFWSSIDMNATILLSTGVVASYLLGFSIISPKTEYNPLVFNNNHDKSLWVFSKSMLVIVFLMFWLPILSILSLALIDYSNLIQVGTLSSIGKLYWVGQYLAVFPLFFIFYLSFKYSKKLNIFLYLGFFYIFSYFFIGDRGGFLFYIIIPVVLYHYIFKKIKMKKMGGYILLILFLSSLVSISRVSSTYNPIEAYKLYQENENKGNPIVEAVSEFGQSIKTVNIVVANFPDEYSYWYGKSYIDSLLIVFPSISETRTSQGIDMWLTENFFGKYTHGRGGSMLMESFANFGLLGSIIFFNLLGIISAYLYKKTKTSENLLTLLVYVSFIAVICIWMRNTSSYLFRTMVWTVFLYYVVIIIAPKLPRVGFKK